MPKSISLVTTLRSVLIAVILITTLGTVSCIPIERILDSILGHSSSTDMVELQFDNYCTTRDSEFVFYTCLIEYMYTGEERLSQRQMDQVGRILSMALSKGIRVEATEYTKVKLEADIFFQYFDALSETEKSIRKDFLDTITQYAYKDTQSLSRIQHTRFSVESLWMTEDN